MKAASTIELIISVFVTTTIFRATSVYDTRIYEPPIGELLASGLLLSGLLLSLAVCVCLWSVMKSGIVAANMAIALILWQILAYRVKQYVYANEFTELALSLLCCACVIAVFVVSVPSLVYRNAIRSNMLTIAVLPAGIVWALVSLVVFVQNSDLSTMGGRFVGISIHPNHAGMVAAITSVISFGEFWLREYSAGRCGKIAFLAITGIFLGFVIWTGSRTALVVAMSGFAFVAMKRKWSVGLVLAAMCLIVSTIVICPSLDLANGESDLRTLSADNTRYDAWGTLINAFLANPVLGGADTDTYYTENSYLFVLARSGLVGAVPYFCGLCLLAVLAWKELGRTSSLARVSASVALSCLCGGFFEGYMKDELSFPIIVAYLCTCLLQSTHLSRTSSLSAET